MSTELAALFLTDYIRKQVDSGSLTGALYNDSSKAFDTISHSLLLDKLPSYGITNGEFGWFKDYLFLRKQSVEINGTITNAYPVYTGVPQGSILGLLLFLLHISDIERYLGHSSIITYVEQRRIQRGAKGARAPIRFYIPNFLINEIIGFCLTTSSHKSNFYANHAHYTHHAQNWSVEPLSDFCLDPLL